MNTHNDNASTTTAESAGEKQPRRRTGSHVRFFYLIRLISSWGGLAIAFFYIQRFSSFSGYSVSVFLFGLAYPHIGYFLQTRMDGGRRVEHATLILDAFLGGSVVYFVGFSELPSIALALITLVNPVAFTGFRLMGWSVLAMGIAIALPTWILGPNFDHGDIAWINLAAIVYMFIYYSLFARAVYTRTIALQGSRRELRRQKISVEIEKKRSDTLLLSILPASSAQEFEQKGTLAPRRVDGAALLLVNLPDTARQLAGDNAESTLSAINDLFKAIDTICARHRMEGIKTLGEGHLAVGGLDAARTTVARDAIAAAIEIGQYLEDANATRAAHGQQALTYRVVVHSGPVLAGLVETTRFSFDVFGDCLTDLLILAREAPLGRVSASTLVCERAGSDIATSPGKSLALPGGRSVELCDVRRK